MEKQNYKTQQCKRQMKLMRETDTFRGDEGHGKFAGIPRDFVLSNPDHNLFPGLAAQAREYFRANKISWWRGNGPSGHTLSSQVACLNHLFPIMHDHDAVQAIIRNLRKEIHDVLPVAHYKGKPVYIDFEVVSGRDYLNEEYTTRGSNCTSVDAVIMGKHIDGRRILIPIEWKYSIVDPSELLAPVATRYPELCEYLKLRYW